MRPYVVRFVSLESCRGKTLIASSVITKLKIKGYLVAAIKHAAHSIDIGEKDTDRYIRAGADIVIASSSSIGAIYYSKWVDSLEYALGFINMPIIIVEGFKSHDIGDVIAVIDTPSEFDELSKNVKGNIVALVCSSEAITGSGLELKVFNKEDIEGIASFIELRALKFIESQLPQTNCGYCGVETCSAFAKLYAMGMVSRCPVISGARLIVNSKEISLNPFVKQILKTTVDGFISALKGVPKERRKILIELEL